MLYEVLERIIAKTMPLWDATLNAACRKKSPRIDVPDGDYYIAAEDPAPGALKEERLVNHDLYDNAREEWDRTHRVLVQPEPQPYAKRTQPAQSEESSVFTPRKHVNLRSDFADDGLQITVKLADIHLTPEKPNYEGGSWHIEGSLNEHICATALYYYDCENITDSSLAFRETMNDDALHDALYEQDDYEHLERLYDIK